MIKYGDLVSDIHFDEVLEIIGINEFYVVRNIITNKIYQEYKSVLKLATPEEIARAIARKISG